LLSLFLSDPDCTTAQPGAGPSGVVLLVRDARIFAVSIDHNTHRTTLGSSRQLVTGRWHHIAVTVETTGTLLQQPSAVTLFLDGQRIDSGQLRIAPASQVGFLSLAVQCGMPCGDWPAPLEALRAQLGSVYLFSQALRVDQVRIRLSQVRSVATGAASLHLVANEHIQRCPLAQEEVAGPILLICSVFWMQ
jgi:hypothetical protein